MSTPPELANLVDALAAIHKLFARYEQRGMVIGGVAVSLLSQPRYTGDVDAVILGSTAELPQLFAAASHVGFAPRIADPQTFARRSRVLLLRHDETGVPVDISLGLLPFEVEAVERSQLHQLGKLQVRLPTPEDLIILKAVAHRPQDLLDIQALAHAHPDLDRERIKRWVSEFAQLLETAELWEDIKKWIDQ